MWLERVSSSSSYLALNSLKIWQKTKALKMSVRCRTEPSSTNGTASLPELCVQNAITSNTLFTLQASKPESSGRAAEAAGRGQRLSLLQGHPVGAADKKKPAAISLPTYLRRSRMRRRIW